MALKHKYNKDNPSFSVIIPTYNREKLLQLAIESVLKQTYSNFELIIIDDGSTDATQKIVQKYHNQRINYYYQSNQGPAAARNYGLKQAKGKFICFLDSDDRFLSNKLEITHNYIEDYPEYHIFHTQELWYRNHQILPQKGHHKKHQGYIFEKALKICSISISTAAISKVVFANCGDFDPNLLACEDYDFWLRATSRYPVKLIDKVLTLKEGGNQQQQSKKFPAMDIFRIYAIEKILKYGNLDKQQYRLAVQELTRKAKIYIKGARKRKKIDEVKKYQQLIAKYNS